MTWLLRDQGQQAHPGSRFYLYLSISPAPPEIKKRNKQVLRVLKPLGGIEKRSTDQQSNKQEYISKQT
nr:MAG TPA: hypothetical protein [Caudoviricetes sp.]